MRLTLAMFKNLKHNFLSASEKDLEGAPDWLRMTEFIECEFPDLPPSEVTQKQLKAIGDRQATEVHRHALAMADLDEERSKLLALTHDSGVLL